MIRSTAYTEVVVNVGIPPQRLLSQLARLTVFKPLFNGQFLSSLILLTVFTGCGRDSPTPQSGGDTNVATDAPVAIESPAPRACRRSPD